VTLHIALGQRVGLTPAQVHRLATHADHPAEYGEVERLVIRYAEQLTTRARTDEDVDAQLRKHLSDRELVELAVTVATANATTRICNALKIEEDD
jgi:alkylhydroperoxidase family enzyme